MQQFNGVVHPLYMLLPPGFTRCEVVSSSTINGVAVAAPWRTSDTTLDYVAFENYVLEWPPEMTHIVLDIEGVGPLRADYRYAAGGDISGFVTALTTLVGIIRTHRPDVKIGCYDTGIEEYYTLRDNLAGLASLRLANDALNGVRALLDFHCMHCYLLPGESANGARAAATGYINEAVRSAGGLPVYFLTEGVAVDNQLLPTATTEAFADQIKQRDGDIAAVIHYAYRPAEINGGNLPLLLTTPYAASVYAFAMLFYSLGEIMADIRRADVYFEPQPGDTLPINKADVTFGVVEGATVRIAASNSGVEDITSVPNGFTKIYEVQPSWGPHTIVWKYADRVGLATDTGYNPNASVAGSGQYLRTFTVTDGTDPIAGSSVVLTNGSVVWGPVLTDAAGSVAFALAPGTWIVQAASAGYSTYTQPLVVSASGTLEVELVPFSLPTAEAGEVVAYLTAFDIDNNGVSGVQFQFSLTAANAASGRSFSRAKKNVTSGLNGLVTVTLLQNASYVGRRLNSQSVYGDWVPFSTGTVTPMALPEILGKPLT